MTRAKGLTEAQNRAVSVLRNGPSTLSAFHPATIKALIASGLIERYTPEARTFAEAKRGRVPGFRLTEKGRDTGGGSVSQCGGS
jgi:hypothetical protein